MKLILVIFLPIFILFSCNNQEQEQINNIKNNISKDTIVVQENKTSTVVDDTPKEEKFYTIENLDIMKHDLGFFNVKQAEIECQKLGDGWRLPNEAELNLIYEKNEELGEFKSNYYVGMDSAGTDEYEENVTVYLRISVINGEIVMLQTDEEVYSVYGVRAVRNHKN
jgi:hypothetical protein